MLDLPSGLFLDHYLLHLSQALPLEAAAMDFSRKWREHFQPTGKGNRVGRSFQRFDQLGPQRILLDPPISRMRLTDPGSRGAQLRLEVSRHLLARQSRAAVKQNLL